MVTSKIKPCLSRRRLIETEKAPGTHHRRRRIALDRAGRIYFSAIPASNSHALPRDDLASQAKPIILARHFIQNHRGRAVDLHRLIDFRPDLLRGLAQVSWRLALCV